MKRFITMLLVAAAICCVVYIVNNHEEIFADMPKVEWADNKKAPVAPAPVATKSENKTPVATQPPKPAPKPAAPAPKPVASASKPAVQNTQHLNFKGVAIDGNLASYVKAMQGAGFTLLKSGNGVARMRGDFAGHKGCLLSVSTLNNHDLVCRIDVTLTEREKWVDLNGDYTSLKSMLTQKYGAPAKCVERFEGIYGDDDSSKMLGIKFDRYKYYSIFKTSKGDITLRIDRNDYDCFVSLTYADKINSSKVNETVMSDL